MGKSQMIGCVISEETRSEIEFKPVHEGKDGYIVAEGILQDGGVVNRNKRFYGTEELYRAIQAPRIRELVRTGNLVSELGHPLDQSIHRQSTIVEKNGCCFHKKLWMDGNLVKSWFTGTSNELGKAFNEDLRRGRRPSFSLRAIGSLVNENGINKVKNMVMITYDKVIYPSHIKAYMTNIVSSEEVKVQESALLNESAFLNNPKIVEAVKEDGNCLDATPLVFPLTQDEMARFMVEESDNIQSVISTFDVLYESIKLDPTLNTVTMKTRMGDTFHICLEDAVKREVLDGIAKFF